VPRGGGVEQSKVWRAGKGRRQHGLSRWLTELIKERFQLARWHGERQEPGLGGLHD
jgi:hypothetical protein